MVKPVKKAEISSFVKGFLSEASPLNFPPDACRDEENFKLNVDGSRQRRLGIDFEDDNTFINSGTSSSNISAVGITTYKWVGAGRDSSKEFLVVQVGLTLSFFDLSELTLSADGFAGSVTLTTGALPSVSFSYAAVEGILIVTSGKPDVNIIEWDGASFTTSTTRLKIRDFFGVEDGYQDENINLRPLVTVFDEDGNLVIQGIEEPTLSRHIYNLYNQGWAIGRRVITVTRDLDISSDVFNEPISFFTAQYGAYPANSERVITGLGFQPVVNQTPNEVLILSRFNESFGLEGAAPNGYFIIDALERGVSRKEKYSEVPFGRGIPNLLKDSTPGGPKITCDFAGRVFYSGFSGEIEEPEPSSPDLSAFVLFSQVVKGKTSIGKCYQDGDPTSREGSDIVDTDGGYIRISGMKNPVSMNVMGNSLFIIAENGVWGVTGGNEFGFTATNYKVEKISNFGSYSEKSVLEIGDKIIYWGDEGIFVIVRDQVGAFVVQSLSINTIQKFYLSIDPRDRKNVRGIYDTQSKEIRWLYGSNKLINGTSTVHELILNLTLGSFSKNKFYNATTNNIEILDYASKGLFTTTNNPFAVVIDDDSVVVGTDVVVVSENEATPVNSPLKYLVFKRVGDDVFFSFAHLKDTKFRDWRSVDDVGVDAKAFGLTGAIVAGDTSVTKFTPYLVMHFLRTEFGVEEVDDELVPKHQSGCMIRSQWDWANTINSGKWSSLFQAYRYKRPLFIVDEDDEFDNGFEVVSSKNKLRGAGKALSIYFETQPDKDCIILGWSLSLTGNSLA